jgi:uncharacterized protein (DUF1330 family)
VSVSGREPLRLRASFFIQMQENAMNRFLTIGLAMLAGVVLGAAAVQGLHAQAKPPAYSVTEVDVHDADAYTKEFLPVVQPLVKKSGGTLIAGSFKVTAIRGTAPKRVAINRWESVETATAFYNSPEYKAALAIGEKYATFRQYALEGLPQ